MKFFTEVNIAPTPKKIEHNNNIVTIGSCFAENIGNKFSELKFNSLINPFGVLYNSASIKNSLELISEQKVFSEDELIFDQDEWHSFYHHSDFSHHKKEAIISKINSTSASVFSFLSKTDWLVVSLGTSFVYHHNQSDTIVSNCHKIPQKEFTRVFLSQEENYNNIKEIINLQLTLNPNTKFILTVSPVRHLKDGTHNNQLSKASLLLAVNQTVKDFEYVYYFPSYEIIMDELRDYRYYDTDLVHPNSQAVNYIWEKFSYSVLSDKCRTMINEIEKIVNASKHKVRNVRSNKSREFAKKILNQIDKIEGENPHIDFSKEKQLFNSYVDIN